MKIFKKSCSFPHSSVQGGVLPLIIFVVSICFHDNSSAQSGQKYSTGGNLLSPADKFGSVNNAPINFYTNNILRGLLTAEGNLDMYYHARFRQNLQVDSLLTALNLTILQETRTRTLQVTHDARIGGVLHVGNMLMFDGVHSRISSNGGTISFGNNHLHTTGSIDAGMLSATSGVIGQQLTAGTVVAGQISTSGNVTAGSVTVTGTLNAQQILQNGTPLRTGLWLSGTTGIYPDTTLVNRNVIVPGVYANTVYAHSMLQIGTLKLSNGGQSPGSNTKDTIVSSYNLAILTRARAIDLSADTFRVSKGSTKVVLDVNGMARFRDYVWVEEGIIVGEAFQGRKGEFDTIVAPPAKEFVWISRVSSENIISDTVRSETLSVKSLLSETMRAGTDSGTVIIDGTTNRIYSSSGVLNFGGNQLMNVVSLTANTINAGSMNVGNMMFDSLCVVRRLKVGNTINLGPWEATGEENHIYTTASTLEGETRLFIQSINQYDHHTIINAHNKGRVGIGTSTPIAKLDINASSTDGTIMRIIDNDYGGPFYNILEVRKEFVDTAVIQPPQAKSFPSVLFVISDTGNVGINTSNPLQRFHVRGKSYFDGNVGIGVIDPKYKLDVCGIIRAREIKVNILGCDYVFEKDYPLMSIYDLETYIDTMGHLPHFPPAKEMEENGIGLSDMNTRLLRTVEELTLYTIQQQKQIDILLKRIEELEKIIDSKK